MNVYVIAWAVLLASSIANVMFKNKTQNCVRKLEDFNSCKGGKWFTLTI
jgi:hypothetical protein